MEKITEFEINKIPLKYPREEFLSDISRFPEEDWAKCGITKGVDGFDGLLQSNPESKINPYVERFLRNKTTFESEYLEEYFDNILKDIPEFVGIIGKLQHKTHAYTVDVHTIKTLQAAYRNPLYETLTPENKTILKYAILLHDIGKKGGVIHHGHEFVSAEYAEKILKPSPIKSKIIADIKNHEWFKDYCQNVITASDVLKRCHSPEISMIMAKADLSSVNSWFHYHCTGTSTPQEFDKFMDKKFSEVFVL